jgi:hypothetical protein
MNNLKKSIVTMLLNDSRQKVTLFTTSGESIELDYGGFYDVEKLIKHLTPLLNDSKNKSVDIDLSEYISSFSYFNEKKLKKENITITTTIDCSKFQDTTSINTINVKVIVGNDKINIPDVENLKLHINRANDDNSPSIINFFKRVASVIKNRKHSGEDLMKFIKQSNLPITNSGRIIAYKRVSSADINMINKYKHINKHNIHEFYVDSFTRKIVQRVGSRVTMPIDMVNDSRYVSCASGLHVANLDFIHRFYGDNIIIVLVDPENFIAVPKGENTKARVCSYDIIGVLDKEQTRLIINNKTMSKNVYFEDLITKAIEGNTIEPFEEVIVGNQKVDKIQTLIKKTKPKNKPKNKVNGKPLSKKDKNTHTKKFAKTARKEKQKTNKLSLYEQAYKLYDEKRFEELHKFKTDKKKSYAFFFGFDTPVYNKIIKINEHLITKRSVKW